MRLNPGPPAQIMVGLRIVWVIGALVERGRVSRSSANMPGATLPIPVCSAPLGLAANALKSFYQLQP
jgi:hypothetical protein